MSARGLRPYRVPWCLNQFVGSRSRSPQPHTPALAPEQHGNKTLEFQPNRSQSTLNLHSPRIVLFKNAQPLKKEKAQPDQALPSSPTEATQY